jgi:hypothetical protein
MVVGDLIARIYHVVQNRGDTVMLVVFGECVPFVVGVGVEPIVMHE